MCGRRQQIYNVAKEDYDGGDNGGDNDDDNYSADYRLTPPSLPPLRSPRPTPPPSTDLTPLVAYFSEYTQVSFYFVSLFLTTSMRRQRRHLSQVEECVRPPQSGLRATSKTPAGLDRQMSGGSAHEEQELSPSSGLVRQMSEKSRRRARTWWRACVSTAFSLAHCCARSLARRRRIRTRTYILVFLLSIRSRPSVCPFICGEQE